MLRPGSRRLGIASGGRGGKSELTPMVGLLWGGPSSLSRLRCDARSTSKAARGRLLLFPSPLDDRTAWAVLTCHDLSLDPEVGHVDLWAAVVDRLAAAWGRDAGGSVHALALAPLAVLPSRQRRGAGSSLVREGLRSAGCTDTGSWSSSGTPSSTPGSGSRRDWPVG